ncbi:MAG: magnesium and cobalt exporter, family [Cryptosporangiaceae bacterium]|nr:magnesium and cobalt exporter, family [Cryptosporangiaceae bacterium]
MSAALKSLSFQLSGAQFGITVTALLTGYLAQPALARLIRPALESIPVISGVANGLSATLGLIIATLLSVLFGELIPKNAALAAPMPIVRFAAPWHRLFSAVFAWIIRALNGSANWFVRRLGIEPQEELASARSPEELGLLAAISARAGALPAETAKLLQRTIRFGEKRAAEVMTPRVDVVALDAEATVADLLRLARESGHSRFPVYLDNLDQVIGVSGVLDAFAVPESLREATLVRAIAQEPVLVPESLDLDTVLDRLQEARTELAVVVDEYGGTDGIVTTEDLAEELVGEIDDEYDPPTTGSATVTAPSSDLVRVVPGMLREDELVDQTGFRLPEGLYETLAGFLLAQLGHIPREGESLDYQGWHFTVTHVDRRRIEQVEVRPPEDWHSPDEPDSERGPAPQPTGAGQDGAR